MRLYLIGYLGCGKSTIGRTIARVSSLRFVDTDTEVERAEGATVADIITHQGDDYFRAAERNALMATVDADNVVVSTGGGLPMWGDNMEIIKGSGVSVYLRRTPANIISRLSPYGRQKRPKFRGLNDEQLLAFMTTHMAEREPIYSTADFVIDCDTMSDSAIIDTILRRLKTIQR